MEGKLNFLFALLAVILIAWVAMMTYSCSGHATPPYFNKRLTLEEAATQAEQNDRIVFALFTADWCEPCTKFKSRALADSRIVDWIKAHAQPVYVDMTKADSGDADAAAVKARYDINYYPSVLLMRKGREVARLEDALSAKDLLKWLTEKTAIPKDRRTSTSEA
jgi:thiol:disulfide interchange protein